ncbi:MAG: N-acetylneuraminate synthase family protein, partial [Spirochaetaceae bacterium]|nr:N-acetylneuraminate synthase family protein [Spirochaetaceae bacterium]
GSIAKAKELVCAAKESGADCVKFQIVYADEILHPLSGNVPLPGGDIPLYDVFKKLEVSPCFYAELKTFTEDKGLIFLASVFGHKSACELESLNPVLLKAASPELNFTELLQKLSSMNLPALLSLGVSTLADIERAVSFFKHGQLCLLHCVTAYPAPPEQYNLSVMCNISSIFGIPCGLSDHTLDPVIVPVLSVVCGAPVIEKHFCLSHNDGGLDDKIALEPDDFKKMTAAIRIAQTMPCESILQNMCEMYNAETVNKILGNGIKQLAPCEEANYERTNRSIHALRTIKSGELITKENAGILRTEKVLRPGLQPYYFDQLAGKKAANTIAAGEGIRMEDLLFC